MRELAQLALERSVIRSPIAGTIQVAQLDVGEMAAPGVVVARVVDPSSIEVPVLLPALARDFVRPGNRVLLRADRAGAQPVEAHITRVAPEDDPATRTMTVYAEAPGSAQLAPGVFVEAEVSSSGDQPRTLVPRRAVSGGRIVVVRDGVAHQQSVEVEFTITGALAPALPDTEWVVLREALPSGTLVVLDGSRRIVEGAPVQAVRAGDADSAGSGSAATAESASPVGSPNQPNT
jgi:multidrug efflux pump subunit AcrA (membrane-fusion protein)